MIDGKTFRQGFDKFMKAEVTKNARMQVQLQMSKFSLCVWSFSHSHSSTKYGNPIIFCHGCNGTLNYLDGQCRFTFLELTRVMSNFFVV